MSQQEVLNAVYTAMADDTDPGGVAALATGGIYDTDAPKDIELAFVRFNVVTDPVNHTFEGSGRVETDIDISCFGKREDSQETARVIAQRVHDLFNRQALTIANHGGGYTEVRDKGILQPDGNSWQQVVQIRVQGTEA